MEKLLQLLRSIRGIVPIRPILADIKPFHARDEKCERGAKPGHTSS